MIDTPDVPPSILVRHANARKALRIVDKLRSTRYHRVQVAIMDSDMPDILPSLDDVFPQETKREILLLGVDSLAQDDLAFLERCRDTFDGPIILLVADANGATNALATHHGFDHVLKLDVEDDRFTEALETKLATVALGVQMENRISHNIQRAAKMQLNILKVIIKILESKDPYTRFHSHSVTKWSRMLGRKIGLSEEDLTTLGLGAVLHDLGKIGVPEAILNKETRLTDSEMELMKLHPVIGSDLLAPQENLEHIRPIILHHHERWDGNGYPAGLAGEDIPLMARIVALADSYDTMRTRRVYKTPMPIEECLEQIRQNKGTQFDPVLADAFIELVEEHMDQSTR